MKFFGKIIILLFIVVPVIVCWKYVYNIWNEEEDVTAKTGYTGEIDPNSNENSEVEDNINEVINEMGGEEYTSTIGNPTSKIIENAKVSISVASVYRDADEESEVVTTLGKNTIITILNYPEGWSRIKTDKVSGWMRTKNIEIPSDIGDMTIGTVVGRTGIVNVTSLNVRETASTTAKVLDRLSLGTDVKILELSGDWYRIKWNYLEGWVAKQYIDIN